MKKIFLLLVALTGAVTTTLTAQEQKPVQLSFTTERANDTLVYVCVKAKMSKEGAVFSANKKGAEDIASTIEFDSVVQKYVFAKDTAIEVGSLKTQNDAEGAVYRLYYDSVIFKFPLHIPAKDSVVIKGIFNWLGYQPGEMPSDSEKFSLKVVPSTSDASKEKRGVGFLLKIFLACFAAGLLIVFTPCVFPMMPVTVSFFLKKSKTRAEGIRNALWYSFSIVLIYTIPTLILTLIFGDKVLYEISVSAGFNIFIFLVFMIFAISFFGAFELTLPSSWAGKTDEQARKGGLWGIFFMALTLVIVSFSCTGPAVGALLAQTSSEGIGLAPVVGMLGVSIAIALPFSLLAIFPSMLHSLPKSGGWLNSVKVIFGFIELALALKFLSNVDLIYHWRLLDREIFLAIWIVIFALMGLYLLGKLKFSHDSDLPYVSIPRLFLTMATFTFVMYLIPGMWGAPLKMLGGWIPPTSTQDFNLDDLQYKIGSGGGASHASSTSSAQPPKKHVDKLHVPFGLIAYYDLEEGMAAAKALNKPVMLDFTGHSCANCRKMEQSVWKDPEVLRRMKEDFVLISLYVDESTELPDAEQYTDANGKNITTVGNKNLDYEITKFNLNAQPLYMFLDLKGNPLSDVRYGYDSDIPKFTKHLETVKEEFKKR